MAPLITLTSDFGLSDSYVAELKGALFSRGPAALRVTDLSHELPAFDIHAAALFLKAAVPRFPAGTIHVVVVDPGVGSARAPLIVELSGQLLVGPDNGQFGYLYDGSEQVYTIDPSSLGAGALSSTFHGRDLFAPAAAMLACGASAGELGSRTDSYRHLVFPMVEFVGETLIGHVIHVDRFGNLVTNISRSALLSFIGEAPLPNVQVAIGERSLRGVRDHYAEVEPSGLLALIGSGGLLEIAVREGSARDKLDVGVGKQVRVHCAR